MRVYAGYCKKEKCAKFKKCSDKYSPLTDFISWFYLSHLVCKKICKKEKIKRLGGTND